MDPTPEQVATLRSLNDVANWCGLGNGPLRAATWAELSPPELLRKLGGGVAIIDLLASVPRLTPDILQEVKRVWERRHREPLLAD